MNIERKDIEALESTPNLSLGPLSLVHLHSYHISENNLLFEPVTNLLNDLPPFQKWEFVFSQYHEQLKELRKLLKKGMNSAEITLLRDLDSRLQLVFVLVAFKQVTEEQDFFKLPFEWLEFIN